MTVYSLVLWSALQNMFMTPLCFDKVALGYEMQIAMSILCCSHGVCKFVWLHLHALRKLQTNPGRKIMLESIGYMVFHGINLLPLPSIYVDLL